MFPLASIFLSRTALEVYCVIALGLILLGLKHHYDEDKRDEGRAEYASVMAACGASLSAKSVKACTAAITQSASDLKQSESNNATLTATVGRQNAALAALTGATARAQAAAAAANKQADADAAFYAERLKGLQESIAHPSENPNADADRVLRALARDRLLGK